MPFPLRGGYAIAGKASKDAAIARGVAMNSAASAFNAKNIKKVKGGRNAAKMVAGGVVAATAFGTYRNNSGRAADRMGRGRPTGVYGN